MIFFVTFRGAAFQSSIFSLLKNSSSSTFSVQEKKSTFGVREPEFNLPESLFRENPEVPYAAHREQDARQSRGSDPVNLAREV